MPDLLIELFSEEIPARMQRRAADDFRRLVTDGLVEAGLTYEGARAFVTPRRIALNVEGLPARSADTREERKGPRVGAPEKALEGFLKSAGLSSIDQCETREDKKGAFHVAVIERPGKPAPEIISDVVEGAVRGFPWPKSMRWGDGSLRWVRPLHAIVATFGPKGEDPEVVPLDIDGIVAGNTTQGHRMMAPAPFPVSRFEDYAEKLEAAKVEIDLDRRKEMILADAKNLAMAAGLDLVEDAGLAEEVAGLVEWPVVLMGSFDEAFLELPPEVLATSMRAHQKYFALRDAATGRLANRFIVVANIEAEDGGTAIVAGNERVLAARLADARFFWEQDLKVPLEDRLEDLEKVTFHEKLGTQYERVKRIERLARELAGNETIGADPELAERAARLAKADLTTGMVGEFPELQGLMGRYYAEKQGEPPEVCAAIEEHYRPQGPGDAVPSAPVSLAVALADKIDTLVGFWVIDEKPTGSKDPYALRRAALGVVRMVLENGLRIEILNNLRVAHRDVDHSLRSDDPSELATAVSPQVALPDLLAFFADRLKVHLREEGKRHDLVDAIFSLQGQDDLLLIVRRVEALEAFLSTDDGANLLTGVKRAANILRAEEKKDGAGAFDGAPDPTLFDVAEEKRLFEAIGGATGEAEAALKLEDFADAMAAIARLRAPVDAFFDTVTVNAEDPALRANRLKLLNQIRTATLRIADFSKIEG